MLPLRGKQPALVVVRVQLGSCPIAAHVSEQMWQGDAFAATIPPSTIFLQIQDTRYEWPLVWLTSFQNLLGFAAANGWRHSCAATICAAMNAAICAAIGWRLTLVVALALALALAKAHLRCRPVLGAMLAVLPPIAVAVKAPAKLHIAVIESELRIEQLIRDIAFSPLPITLQLHHFSLVFFIK